jgi:amidase
MELKEKLDNEELTSEEIVSHFLKQISKLNKSGPKINAVLEVNPEALLIARARDMERKFEGPRGYLHGIPVLVKDNISTADMTHTSAGSLALANNYALYDSFVAHKLKEAGAIILGKANMTEWANFMTENMTNGYSSRGGQVLNPYGLGCFDVGGSSAGSGAAVAAGMAPVALGTETYGSILSPACNNMLVGIKPTLGLVSRSGIIPIAPSHDTAGPIAKSVVDAAIVLQAIAGYDSEDEVTYGSEFADLDYLENIESSSLNGKKLGVLKSAFKYLDPSRTKLMDRAIDECRKLGATIVYDLEIEDADKISFTTLHHEFKVALNSYLENYTDLEITSLTDVIDFNFRNKETLKFGQVHLLKAEATNGTFTDPEYIDGKTGDLKICRQGLKGLLEEHKLDALIVPGNYGSYFAASAGFPAITVPSGVSDDDRPFGITFVGEAFCEKDLIRIAYAYEKGTNYRVWPNFSEVNSC